MALSMLYTEYNYAECCNLFNVMLNVVMLNVVMLNVVMLNVVMLNVVMLNVVMLNVVMLSVVMPSVVVPWIGWLGTNTLAYYKLWLLNVFFVRNFRILVIS
jgi:hypothetical protein